MSDTPEWVRKAEDNYLEHTTGKVRCSICSGMSWYEAERFEHDERCPIALLASAEQEIERLDRKGNLAFEATLIEKYLDDLNSRKGFTLTPEIRRWIRREWWEIAEATLLQEGDDE